MKTNDAATLPQEQSSSVYIIILTWNHVANTVRCLDSVLQTTYPSQIVVVDNASTDTTAQVIQEKYPSVTLLQNEKNEGYAEGNNVGMRYALERKADFIFILNNDTVINPDTVELLVNELLKHPLAIAVSPKSYFYDSPGKVYFAGGLITEKGSTHHFVGEADNLDGYSTTWLNGCAMLIRCAYLSDVGFFDPRYFLLYEDVDWSLRARRRGYDLRVLPASVIQHKGSGSFDGQRSPTLIYYFARNRHLCYERNFPWRQRLFFHINAFRENFKNPLKTIEILFAATPFQKAIRQAHVDYLLRRFGERKYHW